MSPIPGIVASQITGHLSTSSFESIATVTINSGTQSSILFTSIPSGYKHLQVRILGLTTASLIQPQMRFNGDSSATYTRHSLYGDGTVAAAYGAASVNQIVVGGLSVGMDATYPYVCVIDILDYASTSKNKTVRSLSGSDKNGSGEIGLHSGAWLSTSAVTSISIISAGTYNTYSNFALYGIKG